MFFMSLSLAKIIPGTFIFPVFGIWYWVGESLVRGVFVGVSMFLLGGRDLNN